MALDFIAFHMRDYQRKTQHLNLEGHGAYFLLLQHCWTYGRIPLGDVERAAICGVTVQRWRKQLAPLVAGFFDENGENRRANEEIAKAEKVRLQRAVAGHNGGIASKLRRAELAELQRPLQRPPQRPPDGGHSERYSDRSSGREATSERLINTTSGAARARPQTPAETPQNPPDPSPPAPRPLATLAADAPHGFAGKVREAAQASAPIVSSELAASMAARGWVR